MRLLTLILCIVAILGSALSTVLYFQDDKPKDESVNQIQAAESQITELKTQLQQATTKTADLQKKLAELDNELGETKLKLTEVESLNTQLTRDTAQLRNQLTVKTETEQTLNREIANLKTALTQAQTPSTQPIDTSEIEGYKKTIATLQNRLAALQSNRTANSTTAPLPISATPAPTTNDNKKCTVASIGTPNAFVVITGGVEKGIQVNQSIIITRDGAFIAHGVVSTAKQGFAIAQINRDTLAGNILKGDTVELP